MFREVKWFDEIHIINIFNIICIIFKYNIQHLKYIFELEILDLDILCVPCFFPIIAFFSPIYTVLFLGVLPSI